MPEEVTIGFRGTEDYRRALQRAALDRGLKVQTLIEQAVNQFLNPPPAKESADTPIGSAPDATSDTLQSSSTDSTDSRLRSYASELLGFILNNGSPDDVTWILGNLCNFCDAIRSRRPIPAPTPRPPSQATEFIQVPAGLGRKFSQLAQLLSPPGALDMFVETLRGVHASMVAEEETAAQSETPSPPPDPGTSSDPPTHPTEDPEAARRRPKAAH